MSASQEKTKDPLLPSSTPMRVTNASSFKLRGSARGHLIAAAVICIFLGLANTADKIWMHVREGRDTAQLCPQADVLIPEKGHALWANIGETVETDAFKTRAVNWLAGAVQIPTESYDDIGPVGEDPRWNIFSQFHDYVLGAFPLVHTTLALTKVNTYGLVYVWQGSDPSLKPILLAAHQDVVPVNPDTASTWAHPPYSGYFDGSRIWGRGSVDDKSGLIGILSSVELLLENNFKPTRTVVLSFGFDEEISGTRGAASLSKALLDSWGEDAFAFVVDEGAGFGPQYGGVFATPGIGEKGYLDVRVEVTSAGGHSSIPPKHTSIGILASLLVKYEANPYKVNLARTSPVYKTVKCLGQHAPSLPSSLRKAIKGSVNSNKALHELEKIIFKDAALKSLVGTTTAIDIIQGGVKANALPESAWAVVNHRIAIESSVDAVKAHDIALLEKLADQFNLTYTAFGTDISKKSGPARGTLTLRDAWGTALTPAPVSPTDEAPYELLSGTIKATYNAHRSLEGADNIAVAPGIMSGNTDTRYYWNLSKHIFRYNHYGDGDSATVTAGGVHTVNESIAIDSFVEQIRFFATLILNADESKAV